MIRILLIALIIAGCSSTSNQPDEQRQPSPAPIYEVPEDNATLPEHTKPSGDDVWVPTGEPIRIKGCEDWKKRDPEADC